MLIYCFLQTSHDCRRIYNTPFRVTWRLGIELVVQTRHAIGCLRKVKVARARTCHVSNTKVIKTYFDVQTSYAICVNLLSEDSTSILFKALVLGWDPLICLFCGPYLQHITPVQVNWIRGLYSYKKKAQMLMERYPPTLS